MADTSADVPGKFDCVINGHGYCFADTVEPSLPFRTHRAIYDITPTFLERTNVSEAYGDNAQDFFLTASQHDWSLGEDQRHIVNNNADSVRRFWRSNGVDVTTPGEVKMREATKTLTFSSAVMAGTGKTFGGQIYVADATHLYQLDYQGGITDLGAHGLGCAPDRYGVTNDGTNNVFLSSTQAGSVGVRMYSSGGAFSTFSTTKSTSLEYLNNTLYGIDNTTGKLTQYDTAGSATTLFTWKDATGTGINQTNSLIKVKAYGGNLMILFHNHLGGAELWVYDGVGPQIIWRAPQNFMGHDLEILDGIAFVGGCYLRPAPNQTNAIVFKPAVYYYANGNPGVLWEAQDFSTTIINPADGAKAGHPSVASFDGGLVFNDDISGKIKFYDPAEGSVHSIGQYTVTGNYPVLIGSQVAFLHTRNQTTAYFFPDNTTHLTSATIDTSLFDFSNSLTKMFRGVKVDWAPGSDGNGGSVDISYQIDSLDGNYTSLQTSAVSGTEYTITGATGRAIGIRITLNKGTSTSGPVLKRIYIRAAPQLQQFKSSVYIIDCTGSTDAPRVLRDGSLHPLTGYEQVQNLLSAAQSTTPFSVTDKVNGTFSALVDLQDPEGWDVYEVHPNVENPTKPGSYLVRLKVRQV